MSSSSALPHTRPPPPSDLAWRVVGLVNLYRVLVASALLVLSQLPDARTLFEVRHAREFAQVCLVWLVLAVMLVVVKRRYWPSVQWLASAHVLTDAISVAAVLWATGGASSGLGILLVLPVGAMAVLATSNLHAVFLASLATLTVLFQQSVTHLAREAPTNDYLIAGVLGLVIFLVALLVRPLANRLTESEAIVRRQEIDLANLAQLSQYIVQHLRESILVVDADDRIRLINESAAQMLGDRLAWPGAILGEASPRLLFLLSTWRRHETTQDGGNTLPAADGARLIQPHFASLGGGDRGTVLVFLEDTGILAERVQQSKLAGLGRLSASIAHEIRNPVGAMTHAAQLLEESPDLGDQDRRLTEIIRSNGQRVSRIIDNVLQFSRRGTSKPERILLPAFLEQFRVEFCATLELAPERVTQSGESDEMDVRADPTQLHQILWNLAQNAITHAASSAQAAPVELIYGRLASNGRPFVEVADRGPGIPLEDSERIFEPFFTRSQRGTGLGLFLARELAQANGATLLHEPRHGGGSVFRIVFTDPLRWGGNV